MSKHQTPPFIEHNVSLKRFNTFGIDVKAQHMAHVDSIEKLHAILNFSTGQNTPTLVLGEGSNLLFIDDYQGLVLRNAMKGIEKINEDKNFIWLKVGGGENWHGFVIYCVENNYGGIENLSLIPGSVGATPIQNIGAYGVELKDVFVECEALHLQDQTLHKFTHRDCEFGYRNSIFKNKFKNQYMITSVMLRLNKDPVFNLSYGALKKTLEEMDIGTLNIKAVSDAVMKIRRSKLPDPKQIGNAGSFFKNPEISQTKFTKLKEKFPDIPFYILSTNDIKIPAGWLIEQCGWKGKRFGDIGVYERQALVLVNYGQARGHDIHELAKKIQSSVYERFDIELIPEVNIID